MGLLHSENLASEDPPWERLRSAALLLFPLVVVPTDNGAEDDAERDAEGDAQLRNGEAEYDAQGDTDADAGRQVITAGSVLLSVVCCGHGYHYFHAYWGMESRDYQAFRPLIVYNDNAQGLVR